MRPSDDYPENWDELRRAVYKRDDYTCELCGAQGGPYGDNELHAHHITPVGIGGSHEPYNLVTLCKTCHGGIHGIRSGLLDRLRLALPQVNWRFVAALAVLFFTGMQMAAYL